MICLSSNLCIAKQSVDLQELVSSLQLVFMNNLEISPRGRRAVHNLTSAYTDLFEVPETDRSVAKVPSTPSLAEEDRTCSC